MKGFGRFRCLGYIFLLGILFGYTHVVTYAAPQVFYTTGGAFDPSSYTNGASVALDVSNEDLVPLSMLFNNDGSIIYVMGANGDNIHAYPLQSNYDISSYDAATNATSMVLDVSDIFSNAYSILFNNDGSILYILGASRDDIYGYPLNTNYDISSYTTGASIALDVSNEDNFPTSMLFNSDGSILYVLGEDGEDINAYPLDINYEISSYDTGTSIVLDVSNEDTVPLSMIFNNDGSTLYVLGYAGREINAYPLQNPYDISSYDAGAAATDIVLNILSEEDRPYSILFNNDGSILYVLGEAGGDITAYPLGEVNYIEIAANDGTIDNTNPRDIILQEDTFTGVNGSDFVADGKVTLSNVPAGLTPVVTRTSDTRLRVSFTGTATAHENSDTVTDIQFTFTDTAFTVHTAVGVTDAIGSGNTSITFTDNPQVLYTTGGAFDPSSYTSGASVALDVSNEDLVPLSMLFNNDGSIIYVMGANGDNIHAYPLQSNYDISSYDAAINATSMVLDVSGIFTSAYEIIFNNDGSILYILGAGRDDIYGYPLNTNYDISSYTTGASIALDVSNEDNFPTSMLFNSDGSILYVLGEQGDDINAYPLDTNYDISSYNTGTSIVLDVSNEDSVTTSMRFNDDGSILYVLGYSRSSTHAYPLDTNYDISSYNTGTSVVLNASIEETQAYSILFNEDGSILYVLGEAGGDITAYPLGEVNYSEIAANDGTIDNTNPRDIILENDTFTGVNGSDFVADGKVTLSNVPAGLTPVVTRTSDTRLRVSFTGTATAHENSDTVTDIQFTFTDTAFTLSSAEQVIGAVNNGDTVMTFTNNPSSAGSSGGRGKLTYSCKDPEASNYKTSGYSKQSLCEYDTVEEVTPETNAGTILQEDGAVISSGKEGVSTNNTGSRSLYTLSNSFEKCSGVNDINNLDYEYRDDVFLDINLGEYSEEINKFASIGIVSGFDDGTFSPLKDITRAEFLKITLQTHCYDYKDTSIDTLSYVDVDTTSWQARVIAKAESLGIINGDISENGERVFRPNGIISKIEATKILIRMSNLQAIDPQELLYNDVTVPWHIGYVRTGQTLGLFDPQADNLLFFPEGGVTREYMVYLITKITALYK